VRLILTGLVAAGAAGAALFFKGRRSGQLEAEADAAAERGRAGAAAVRRKAEAGDDQGVQDALQDAQDAARRVVRP
jgi:hypothetical protein